MTLKHRIRLLVIVLTILGAVVFILPLIKNQLPTWLTDVLPEKGAKLGLDLQGGMHLVLGVDTNEAIANRLRSTKQELDQWLKSHGGGSVDVTSATALQVTIADDRNFKDWLDDRQDSFEMVNRTQLAGQVSFTLQLLVDEQTRIRDWAVLQSVETLRNRIDQFGITEPIIQRQGDDRIVVQFPGIDNTQRAIDLIGRTAQLTFHLFRDDVATRELVEQVNQLTEANPQYRNDIKALNAAMAATLPTGIEVRFQRVQDEFGSVNQPVFIEAEPAMTGDTIVDARVRVQSQYNEPYVSLSFNNEGATRFEEVTAQYREKRLAIVLDDVVYSAPTIRERISGGQASIEGGFTIDEARDLSIVLRAGALPAPVKIEEERTVGPSLGRDSINEGMKAIAIGSALVIVFMIIYYKLSGLIANIALLANIIYLFGILGAFEATLTLPGLAGVALTIGMAVDGNIIIFERIREELRLGKSARAAVEVGYSKALSTILDANITTLIAGIVLFQFGTGPVRGFAVTLTVGILTTLFSVLFISKTLMDLYLQRRHVTRLPI